jgi:Na+-transporting NADH:ubiquinone oxidoreductase subunit NqrC
MRAFLSGFILVFLSFVASLYHGAHSSILQSPQYRQRGLDRPEEMLLLWQRVQDPGLFVSQKELQEVKGRRGGVRVGFPLLRGVSER